MNKAGVVKAVQTIRVRYFAAFREARGLHEETLATEASTVGELYDHLREKYHFVLSREDLRVAVNDAFAGWDDLLNSGDELVFIPPVTGG